jgi:hypothetical protein
MLRIITTLVLGALLFSGCQAQTSLPPEVKDNIKSRVDNGTHAGIVVGVIDGDKTYYYSYVLFLRRTVVNG